MSALAFYTMLTAHQFDLPESVLFIFLHRDYSSGLGVLTV